MHMDKETLEAANCWFDRDAVQGQPDLTTFRRRARYQQAMWREARGYPIGTSPSGQPKPNGSMLTTTDAAGFVNFLSPQIAAAVQHRIDSREPGQQFEPGRLKANLLSSMPMCFNLFGECFNDPARLTEVGKTLFGLQEAGKEVRFEWSPNRRDPGFTGDGTAFDAALVFGDPSGPETVIGIETKYHERVDIEARPDAVTRLPRYTEIAQKARIDGKPVFKPDWEGRVLGTELQQIWRDHLLLLSLLEHDSGRWARGCYVLVYPSGHTGFAAAGGAYRDEVLADTSTFRLMTVEELNGAGVLHRPETATAFKKRYLWEQH
jgi:hypothetical protein